MPAPADRFAYSQAVAARQRPLQCLRRCLPEALAPRYIPHQDRRPPRLQRGGARARRGTLFLQYELQEDLGEGAFGRAVRARRRRDDQPVVVKIMHPDTLSDAAREEVRPPAGFVRVG